MQMPKGYPSPELLQRYLEAYRTEGQDGIRRVFREQRDGREYVADLIAKHMEKVGPPPQSLRDALKRHLEKK